MHADIRRSLRWVSLVVMVGVLSGGAGGCESNPKASGAGVGAAAGAGIGAIVGEAAADSPGAGPGIGAAIGALGGYVAADQIEEKEGRDYPEGYHRHGDFAHTHAHEGPHTHRTQDD